MKQFEKLWRAGLVVLTLATALVLSACSPSGGQEAAAPTESPASAIPEILVEVNNGELTIPAEVPSGVVAFKMVGETDALPVRLNEDVTLDQLNEALTQPDPFAALALVTILGGTTGSTDDKLILDLKPGQHALVDLPENAPPLVIPFTAGEPSGAAAPSGDVTVDLVDFNFGMQPEIKAGPKLWQISNKGTQWHEMGIIKLGEGVTIDDVLAMMASEEPTEGPPPFEEVAFFAPIGAGETAWVNWDLPPGEYTVLCFLPDVNGDMTPHLAHGMVAQLTVTE